ncbi:MAPEG family protein [Bradyrhizobium sp.]|jgi:glutathione S-transferase|uniref:MAPEG family protein n=1 Tax=Bradyrhizobium sp. TaxID=376 RepID=UPI003BAE282A
MFHLTALVTCLALLAYFLISFQVGKARATYGVKAPAVSGNPDFERIYRVQMNTLEWMPVFLPALWLFAIYVSDAIAAALGVVWIIGRILYMVGYTKAANKRGPGFGIQAGATMILWLGATVGILWRLIHA